MAKQRNHRCFLVGLLQEFDMIYIMRKDVAIMNNRNQQKAQSLQRILQAAGLRLRQEGLSGAAIATVMQDAGLTHGAFYVHFANKSQLSAAALRHALLDNRKRWVNRLPPQPWNQRLHSLAKRYLNQRHRDQPATGCALAALASEAARSDEGFRQAFEEELRKSLHGICLGTQSPEQPSNQQTNEAIALMALCVGGLSLARAVPDRQFSSQILQACVAAAARIATSS